MGEAIVDLEDESGGGKGADGDGGVAAFQAPEGIATDEDSGRHIGSRNAAFSSGEGEIASEFAEGLGGGEGKRRGWRHGMIV